MSYRRIAAQKPNALTCSAVICKERNLAETNYFALAACGFWLITGAAYAQEQKPNIIGLR